MAFVVAIWAAYFVPLVLRRYDDASTSSALESLSPLSRVISRRRRHEDEPSASDEGDAPAPRPAEAADAESVQSLDRGALAAIEPPARPQVTRQAAIVAARRRRRTLLTLLTALLLVGGLAVFSVVAPVWVAAPAGLVVAWLVACRVQVRSERGIQRTSRPARSFSLPRLPKRQKAERTARTSSSSAAAAGRPATKDEEQTVIVQLEDVEPDRKHVMEAVPLAKDALDDQVVIAVPSISTSGQPLWDPLPVTLPTYVTKPRAGRTVRTIDFDAPGAWTSGHIEGQDVELPGRPAAQDEAPRRASGE